MVHLTTSIELFLDMKMNLVTDKVKIRHPLCTVIVASAVMMGSCVPSFSPKAPPTPIPMPLPDTARSENTVYTVERGSITNNVLYNGRVALSVEEDVYFPRGGQITKVHVQDGELVQKDALIAELDTDILEIDLRLAENSLEVAELRLAEAEESLGLIQRSALIDLEIAQLQLEEFQARIEDNDSGSISLSAEKEMEGRLEKAEIALARTRAEVDPVLELNVERAELNLQVARKALLDARVSAPITGEIRFISLPDERERQVAARAYEPVARLIDPDSLTIEMNLTKEQLSTLSEGMPVTIVALSNQGEVTLPGTIGALPIPFGTGTGPLTEVLLDDQSATTGLIEGSSVDVLIDLAGKEDALLVPVSALFGFSGQYYVRVQDGTQQQTVDVEVGLQNETHAEIISGVTEGQTILGRE